MIDENIPALRVEIRGLDATVSRLSTNVSDLNRTVSSLGTNVSDLKRAISSAERRLDSLNDRLRDFWMDLWFWALPSVPLLFIVLAIIKHP